MSVTDRPLRQVSPRVVVLIGVFGLAIGACASGGAKASRADAERYLRLGYVQMERGQTQEAIASAKQALEKDPKNSEANNFLGLIYLSLSDYKSATTHLKAAVKSNPYFTDAHNNLGVAYRELKDYPSALKEFQIALNDKSYKTPEKVHLNLGYLYVTQGVMSEAVRCFQNAVQANPKYVPGYLGLGSAYQKSGNADLAAQNYCKAMNLAPDSNEAVQAKQSLDGMGARCKP